MPPPPYKTPISVLVVIHTPALDVLLIERAKHPGFWQSVTGSIETFDQNLIDTAIREVFEETGIRAQPKQIRDWQQTNHYEIFQEWRWRYAPGVTHNEEHVFSLEIPVAITPTLTPLEHTAFCWLPWQAAAEKCFSWSNKEAILKLGQTVQ